MPLPVQTPAWTTVAGLDGLISAQRTQLTVPPPGLQPIVWAVQSEPAPHSRSSGRRSLPAKVPPPSWSWSTGTEAVTPVAVSRSTAPRSVRVLTPKGRSHDQTR